MSIKVSVSFAFIFSLGFYSWGTVNIKCPSIEFKADKTLKAKRLQRQGCPFILYNSLSEKPVPSHWTWFGSIEQLTLCVLRSVCDSCTKSTPPLDPDLRHIRSRNKSDFHIIKLGLFFFSFSNVWTLHRWQKTRKSPLEVNSQGGAVCYETPPLPLCPVLNSRCCCRGLWQKKTGSLAT